MAHINTERLISIQFACSDGLSGVETELHVWQVNRFADGKTARRQVFRDRAEALEAAGLRE